MKSTIILILLYLLVLFALFFFSAKVSAQTINSDSLRRATFSRDSLKLDSIADVTKIQKVAREDARKLTLNSAQMAKFKADIKNTNSDFFKPQPGFASNAELLSDSVYVKAFRLAAYNFAFGSDRTSRYYWGSTNVGIGTNGSLSFSQIINIEVSGGQLITADFDGQGIIDKTNNTTLTCVGILYGGIFKQHITFFTASAGLGVVGEFNVLGSSPFGIGVPILLQGFLVNGQSFGLGVGVYANLNSVQSIAGIKLSLALGKLTTKAKK